MRFLTISAAPQTRYAQKACAALRVDDWGWLDEPGARARLISLLGSKYHIQTARSYACRVMRLHQILSEFPEPKDHSPSRSVQLYLERLHKGRYTPDWAKLYLRNRSNAWSVTDVQYARLHTAIHFLGLETRGQPPSF